MDTWKLLALTALCLAALWATPVLSNAVKGAGQCDRACPPTPLCHCPPPNCTQQECPPCRACAPCPSCPRPQCPACPSPNCPQCPKHQCPPCPKPSPPQCPVPWGLMAQYQHHAGIGIYKHHLERLTWKEAKAACEKEGTHLAIINSEAEANLFKAYYRNSGVKDWLFLGFNRGKDGQFYTVHGAPLASTGYVKWGPGEPNNAHNNEHCGFFLATGLLADGWCEAKLTFICEVSK